MKRELPDWVIPAVIVLGVALLAWVGYRAFTGHNAAPGPRQAVHPGEYHFGKPAGWQLGGGAAQPASGK